MSSSNNAVHELMVTILSVPVLDRTKVAGKKMDRRVFGGRRMNIIFCKRNFKLEKC